MEQFLWGGGVGTNGKGEKEGCEYCTKYCVPMYVNGKMIPVEPIPGMRVGE
jgi:hypothetical protein